MNSYLIVHIVTGKYRSLEGCSNPYTTDLVLARVVSKEAGDRQKKPGEYLRKLDTVLNTGF